MSRRQQTAYLDFLLPATSHVTAKELAAACGYTPKHILCSIEAGRLGAFQVPGAGDTRLHTRIPVEIARGFLVEHQTGLEDALVIDQFTRAISRLPKPLLLAVQQEIRNQISTR